MQGRADFAQAPPQAPKHRRMGGFSVSGEDAAHGIQHHTYL